MGVEWRRTSFNIERSAKACCEWAAAQRQRRAATQQPNTVAAAQRRIRRGGRGGTVWSDRESDRAKGSTHGAAQSSPNASAVTHTAAHTTDRGRDMAVATAEAAAQPNSTRDVWGVRCGAVGAGAALVKGASEQWGRGNGWRQSFLLAFFFEFWFRIESVRHATPVWW